MNREQVREAVETAIKAANKGARIDAHDQVCISDATDTIMALSKPPTVTRKGLLNALLQRPYASEHPNEIMERIRRYLTAQGVNVED